MKLWYTITNKEQAIPRCEPTKCDSYRSTSLLLTLATRRASGPFGSTPHQDLNIKVGKRGQHHGRPQKAGGGLKGLMKQYDLVRIKARDRIETDINDVLGLTQSTKGF